VRHAVSALLYVCSSGPDLGERQILAAPEAGRTGRPAALEPQLVPVGWMIGQALRAAAANDAADRAGGPEGCPDRTVRHRPRVHVRRAHWHMYWLGPRSRPGERHAELRWIPPIPVGTGEPSALPPTLRPVEGPPRPASS